MELYVAAMTTSPTMFKMSDLLDYHFRDFEYLQKCHPIAQGIFARCHVLVAHILRHFHFKSSSEYCLFAQRAFSVLPQPIIFFMNEHIDASLALGCLKTIFSGPHLWCVSCESAVQILEKVDVQSRSLVLDMINLKREMRDLYCYAISRYLFGPKKISWGTLLVIAAHNKVSDLQDLLSNKNYILQIFNDNPECLGVWKWDGDVKFVIDAVMDGHLTISISDDWLTKFVHYFLRHRLDTASFKKFIQAIRPTSDQSVTIYNLLLNPQ